MRIYNLGNNGFVTPSVVEALGSPRHHAQARVYIPADSKRAAVELSTSCGVSASVRDPEVRAVPGPSWSNFDLFAPGAIYVVRLDGHDSPLVRLTPGGKLTVLGLVLPPRPRRTRGTRFDWRPMRFYPLPDADLPRPKLSANEQALIVACGYADRWARWDQAQEEGDSR